MMKNLKLFRPLLDKKSGVKVEGNHLYLYNEIGNWWDEAEALQIVNKIKQMEGDITVHVNSEGGSVFDGMAIMNALKQHKGKKTFIIEGLAASIASVIICGASDKTIAMAGSCMMIHKAWNLVAGNADEMRKSADILDDIDKEIISIYNKKTRMPSEELSKKLAEEWWMFPQTAKDNGFVDEIDTDNEAVYSNQTNLSAFNNVPNEIRNRIKANKPQSVRDFEQELRNLGYSSKEAKIIISKGYGALRDADADNNDNNEMLFEKLILERSNTLTK